MNQIDSFKYMLFHDTESTVPRRYQWDFAKMFDFDLAYDIQPLLGDDFP